MPSFFTSATLLATALISAASAAPYRASIEKRASGGNQVVAYFGQTGGQPRLRTYCDDDSIDIIPFGLVDGFPYGNNYAGKYNNGYISTNFGNQCGDPSWPGTNIFSQCSAYYSSSDPAQSDIAYCQAKGKKILISIGGGAASQSYQFHNDDEGRLAAQQVWDSFGPVPSTAGPRPFGSWTVDGFDLDLEMGGSTGVRAFAQKLRDLIDAEAQAGGKTYILTAAPQCILPDAQLSDALLNVPFDMVFIQFYNNPSCSVSSTGFNLDTWAAQGLSGNPQIFVGLPGSPDSAGSGYIDVPTMENMVSTYGGRSYFGGIMLWDATTAAYDVGAQQLKTEAGGNYAIACKDALLKKNPPVTTTTTTSTTTTQSKTTTATTATTTSSTTTTTAAATSSTTTSTASSTTSQTSSTSTVPTTTPPATSMSTTSTVPTTTPLATSTSTTSTAASTSTESTTTSAETTTSATTTTSEASTTTSKASSTTTTAGTTSSESTTTSVSTTSQETSTTSSAAATTTTSEASTTTSGVETSSTTSGTKSTTSAGQTSSTTENVSSTTTGQATSSTTGMVTTTKTSTASTSPGLVSTTTYNAWSGWTGVTSSRPVEPTSKTTPAPWISWSTTSKSVKPIDKTSSTPEPWASWQVTTSKSVKPTEKTTSTPEPWVSWQLTTSKPVRPTSTKPYESWNSPEITVTSTTTTYVDVCPTGYTTVTATITATITIVDNAQPTGWPSNDNGVPAGCTTSTTVCNVGCAATPVTVTVTVPTPVGTITVVATNTAEYSTWATPVQAASSSPAYSTWATPVEAVTGKPTGSPVAASSTWSSWAADSTNANSNVKAYTGGAAVDQAPATAFSVAVCFAIAVAGLIL